MAERQQAKAGSTPSIGRRMARGAAWMVVLQSADRILGFLSMLVLARLLVPADFGLVALSMAVIGSLAAFSEFGLDLALIQNQSAERRHYDTAWTLGLLRGFLLAGLLLLLAEPYAGWMGDDRLAALVSVLVLVPLSEGFNNIGIVDFRKELNFKKEFLFRFSSRVAGVLTTITLAIFWRDYWALVIGQLTASALRLILSYVLHPYRPRLSLAAWQDIFHFSKWLFLNGIAQFASRRSATFVVGAFLTPAAVGLFSLSSDIVGLVLLAFIAPIQRTFFPGLAKISHDKAATREVLLKAYSLTVLLSVPLTVGIGLTAHLIVPLALGTKWLATIPVIHLLVFSALANSVQAPVRPLLLAIKRPEIVTCLSVINALILIPALILGTWTLDLKGAAWALIVENSIMVVVQHYVLRRFLQISVAHVANRIWRALVSCVAMSAVVWGVETILVSPQGADALTLLSNLTIVATAGALAYGISLLCLWGLCGRPADAAEGIVLSLLKNRLLPAPVGGQITDGGKAEP